MISQKQMKDWIPPAVEHFKSTMPGANAPYPEIYIGGRQTAEHLRLSLLEQLNSPAVETGEGKTFMELINGTEGDAIIIYQGAFIGQVWDYHGHELFNHYIWHELGHFFAIHNENPDDNLTRFLDQKEHPDEYVAQFGYSFWSEFIAETIACKISPEVDIDWETKDWHSTRNSFANYLRSAFNTRDYMIDHYDLAFYFAKLLSDKKALSFLKAADEGVAAAFNDGDKKLTFAEYNIDPAGLDLIDEMFHETMGIFKSHLESLISRDHYWRITVSDCEAFGEYILDMERAMKMMDFSTRLRDRIIR